MKNQNQTKVLSISVPRAFADQVRIRALRDGRTVAGFVRNLLQKELANNERK